MSYPANVYRVMIASPSDVPAERDIIRNAIHEWNAAHSATRRIALLPVGWETNTAPMLGGRPQEIINKQILRDADLLVAVFWSRLGTSTGKDASGTVEEIREHMAAGKPTMVYFSRAKIPEGAGDTDQLAALKAFTDECKKLGLVSSYESAEAFRALFIRQLAQHLNDGEKFSGMDGSSAAVEIVVVPPVEQQLSAEAKALLVAAATDDSGEFFWSFTHSGYRIQTGTSREIAADQTARAEARWKKACHQLEELGLVESDDDKHEFFKITDLGYEIADKVKAAG